MNRGQPALAFTNVNLVPSWDYEGTVLSIDTNVPAYVNLAVFETNRTNITLANGSLEVWVQANWTSMADGGSGPGAWATIWDIGSYTSNASIGAWLLTIDPSGSNLVWVAQSGGSNQMVWTPIDFDAGDFHQIVATWSASNSVLYVDGTLATNTGPILYQPSPTVCSNDGFCVGSLCAAGTNAGTNQFHGQLQWLASYSYPLSTNEVADDFASIAAYISNFGYSVPSGGGSHSYGDSSPTPPPPAPYTNSGGGGGPSFIAFSPPAAISTTNYAAYNEFYLTITNDSTNAYVSICNTLSNLTYEIFTNGNLASTNWVFWQTLLATNTITPAPSIALSSNTLFFNAMLVWSTCTNYNPALPDWWAELYFNSTACVDPNANPAGDGIDNGDKYLLGLNPNTDYVSPLIISPPSGNYYSTPTIYIFSLAGATIKYTTNGSTPSSTNGISVSSGVPLTNLPSGNFTLEAWESGLATNVPVSMVYTIVPATPIFSIPGGVYTSGTTLQISNMTPNATVFYTTNGVDPTTNSAQIQPTNVITLLTNQTVEAMAWLGTNASPVASAAYIVEGPPPNDNYSNAIVLSGSSGTFSGSLFDSTTEAFENDDPNDYFVWALYFSGNSVWYQWTAPSNGNVFFDCSKCDSSFYLTAYDFPATNGPNPTNLVPAGYILIDGSYGSDGYDYDQGPNYYPNADNTSYTLVATSNVTYWLSASDGNTSTLPFQSSWQYVGPSVEPIFSPDTGTYQSNLSVTVLENDPDAVIYYTLDGSDPSTNSAIIASGTSLTISTNTTLKAAAWRPGLSESALKTALYTFNSSSTNPTLTASAPTLSPGNTNFASSLTVTLTCTNAGAVIYYTLDGSIPTSASANVSSGGAVTLTNTTVSFNVSAWVTNMNFSPVTMATYLKNSDDTDGDGIPNIGEILIGSNPLVSDANAPNPNPFAHGLDNMQVYENQSVLIANNYSTENDGVPDWWLVQNGYGVTTLASAIGANGATLLTSFVAGLSPNNPNSRPGQLPQIDFHMVHGPSNSMVMVLDTVTTNIITYFLRCTETDPSSAFYNQTVQEEFSPDSAMAISGQQWGRYFQMTNQLPSGNWAFTLQGVNNIGLWSEVSSNTFGRYSPNTYFIGSGAEVYGWQRFVGIPVPVVGYTNNNDIKEALLVQILRAEWDNWTYPMSPQGAPSGYDDTWGLMPGAALYDDNVQSLTTEESWGTLTYIFQPYNEPGHYNPIGLASYFTAICATPDVSMDCGDYLTNSYGALPGNQIACLGAGTTTNGNKFLALTTDAFNPVDLAYLSLTYRIGSNVPVTLTPGEFGIVPTSNFTFEVALQTETPTLQTMNYYFDGRQYPVVEESEYTGTFYMPVPPAPISYDEHYSSSPTDDGWEEWQGEVYPVPVTNQVIVGQIGRTINLQAWSQVMVIHADGTPMTSQINWIDQDFAHAYLCDPVTGDVPRTSQTNYNGKYMIDTNSATNTGILSPNLNFPQDTTETDHGWRSADFTPTQTGKVIVTTMPDTNGFYGEVTIYVIDMQVDANHDGVVDNRDLTSVDNPMVFWVNNDIDRGHAVDCNLLGADCDWEQDDLNTNDPSLNSVADVPDCSFIDPSSGQCAIPSQRDLEDYARLWIPGLSNLVANLPTNYGVTLQWRNGTGAAIRIYRADEVDGGTNYLFDLSTAMDQTNYSINPYYGDVTASQGVLLSQAFASTTNPTPSDYFIFCGTNYGNDELVLQVTNAYGGVMGEASVFLNLKDIKQIYERWVLGNDYDYTQPVPNIAVLATNDLPPSGSFQYSYNASMDSATPYILYVHGWNMEPWEKDRYAETAYKRLYWQGYQGRFGLFRWPTGFDFSGIISVALDGDNYDLSESNAWESSIGLENRLSALNIQYPGNVYVAAHSMGNIVTGEALRLAGTTLVNTYAAMQGAVPSHCYDQTATFRTIPLLLDDGDPDYYANYWTSGASCYFTNVVGAARYINFFNTNDWALNYWQDDQNFKPDTLLDYGFDGTNFYQSSRVLGFPTNTYEIFSFCDQARCYAIGAQPNLGGEFLTDFQVELDDTPYNFGSQHKYHSGQFRSDNMDRAMFWNKLLIQMRLNR